jgi:hypothetical protein
MRLGVERGFLDERAVDEEPDAERHGAQRTVAAEEHPEHVLPVHGKPVRGVQGVGQAQAARVVRRGHLADGAYLPCRHAQPDERRRRRLRPEDGRPRHALGRGHVPLHQHRRQREHVGDRVEAVARVVLREVVGRTQVHAEQVADGVVVLGAVQPADGDPSRVERRACIDAQQFGANPADHALDVGRVRTLFVLGRHLARPQLLHHQLERVGMRGNGVGRRKLLQVHVALLATVVVAVVAGVREKGLDDRLEALDIGHRSRHRRRRVRGRTRPLRGGHRHETHDGREEQTQEQTHGMGQVYRRRPGTVYRLPSTAGRSA